MAIVKHILKKSSSEVVVRLTGSPSDTTTLDIAGADFLAADQALEAGVTQLVNINGVTWDGENDALITVDRGGVRILTMQGTAAASFNFDGQDMPPLNIENDQNVVVTFGGTGVGGVFLKFRKVAGYASKIETAAFGQYDDETAVGS